MLSLHVSTELELADLFTKCRPAPRFEFLVDMLRGNNPTPPSRTEGANTAKFKVLSDAVTGKISKVAVDLQTLFLQDPTPEPVPFFAKHFQEAPPGPLPENIPTKIEYYHAPAAA